MAQVLFPYLTNDQVYIDPLNFNVPVYGNDPTGDFKGMEDFATSGAPTIPWRSTLPMQNSGMGLGSALLLFGGIFFASKLFAHRG